MRRSERRWRSGRSRTWAAPSRTRRRAVACRRTQIWRACEPDPAHAPALPKFSNRAVATAGRMWNLGSRPSGAQVAAGIDHTVRVHHWKASENPMPPASRDTTTLSSGSAASMTCTPILEGIPRPRRADSQRRSTNRTGRARHAAAPSPARCFRYGSWRTSPPSGDGYRLRPRRVLTSADRGHLPVHVVQGAGCPSPAGAARSKPPFQIWPSPLNWPVRTAAMA